MTVNEKTAREIRMFTLLTHKLARQQLEQKFAEDNIDLTMLQHHIMMMSKRHQPTIADLSRMFGLDPSTLVPTVDALVKKGYITRQRDPNDRRRYPLYLTDSGEALHHHICHELGDDPLFSALQTLESHEIDILRELLRKIVLALPEGEAALAEMEEQSQQFETSSED